jgi:hypothetical protein
LHVPLWNRHFSKPGDSGSWVFDPVSNGWLGMVIGGDAFFMSTFVAKSQPLVDYFILMAGNQLYNSSSSALTPMSFVEG